MKDFLTRIDTTFKGTWLYTLFEKISYSLDNSKLGWSGKKLTAMSITFCVIKLHFAYIDYALSNKNFSELEMILISDFGFICVLFGINTYDKKTIKSE